MNELIKSKYGLMVINSNDRYIGSHIKAKGVWCENEIDIFHAILREGHIVVEVGSNIGAHTLPIARFVGPSGRVHAFEPQRIVFYQLVAMVALNDLTNVVCHQKTVGETLGSAHVPPVDYNHPGNFGEVSLREGWSGDVLFTESEPEKVDVVTVDSLNLPACRLIKVDAEGMDMAVLRGSIDTIKKLRPIIFVEFVPETDGVPIFNFLRSLSYRVYLHSSPGNQNIVCTPQEWGVFIDGLTELVEG